MNNNQCPKCGSNNVAFYTKRHQSSAISIFKAICLIAIVLLVACNLHILTIDVKAVTTSREISNRIFTIKSLIAYTGIAYVILEIIQQNVERKIIKHYICNDCKHEFKYDN